MASYHKKARIVKALSPGEPPGAVYTPYPTNERRLARRCRRGRPEKEAVPDEPDAPPDAPKVRTPPGQGSPWEALEERPRAAWGYLGYASTSPVSSAVAALMEEARHLVAARVCEAGGIKGRAVIRRLRVYDAAAEVLADGDIGEGGDGEPGACNPQVWQTPTLARRLSGCDRLVALACTLGPGVDDAIHTAFAENPGLAVASPDSPDGLRTAGTTGKRAELQSIRTKRADPTERTAGGGKTGGKTVRDRHSS